MKGPRLSIVPAAVLSSVFPGCKSRRRGAAVSWRCATAGVAYAVYLLLLALPAIAGEATPGAIMANPERFDGAGVTMHGRMTNLRTTVSRKGNPYYTFDLAAGGQSVRIFSFGSPPCPEGAGVTVDGKFDREKRVSGRTFYNEVTAARVACQ